MASIIACPMPRAALLANYVRQDTYTDCYRTSIDRRISQAQYVTAFYTTWIFKIERFILQRLVDKPSSDREASQLAHGMIDHFAAWRVEDSSDNQLLLADYRGRTRSWLMTQPGAGENSDETYLYFGSAVTPRPNPGSGEMRLGPGYRALLGFHKIYSRVLLQSAKLRLMKQI